MGHSTAIVIQGVGGPYAAICIIESVIIGIEAALFPCQVTCEHRPHLSHEGGVGVILEMPQQFVDEVEVHVVVVHDIRAVRIAADITVGIHLRAPLFHCPRQAFLGVGRRAGDGRLHVCHLTGGIGGEMAFCAFRHSEDIAEISCSPAIELHTPYHSAVQPRLTIPRPVACCHQGAAESIYVRVGGVEDNAVCKPLVMLPCLVKQALALGGCGYGQRIHAFGIAVQDSKRRPLPCGPLCRQPVCLSRRRVEGICRIGIHIAGTFEFRSQDVTDNTH